MEWFLFITWRSYVGTTERVSYFCILPVLLKDAQLCEHVVTVVLVQFKRRIRKDILCPLTVTKPSPHISISTFLTGGTSWI